MDLNYKIPPEYRPDSETGVQKLKTEELKQINVIVDNVDSPSKAMYGDLRYVNSTAVPLNIVAETSKIGEVLLTWENLPDMQYKIVYLADGLEKREIITSSNVCTIKYKSDTTYLYVWVGYRAAYRAPYIEYPQKGVDLEIKETYKPEEVPYTPPPYYYSDINCKAVLCANYVEYGENKVTVETSSFDKTESLDIGKPTGVLTSFTVKAIHGDIFKLGWGSFSDKIVKVLLNKLGKPKDETKEFYANAGAAYLYLELESGVDYQIALIGKDSAGEFNQIYVKQFKLEIDKANYKVERTEEVSRAFAGKLFEGNTILSELRDLFISFTDEYDCQDYTRNDMATVTKELKLDENDSLYYYSRATLIKPLNSYRGTMRDLEYASKRLEAMQIKLIRASDHKGKLHKALNKGVFEYIDALSKGRCFSGIYDNKLPMIYRTETAGEYHPNPQPCGDYDDKSLPCMFDVVVDADLSSEKLQSAEAELVLKDIQNLFKTSLYACLRLRVMVLNYHLEEEYTFPMGDSHEYIPILDIKDNYHEVYSVEGVPAKYPTFNFLEDFSISHTDKIKYNELYGKPIYDLASFLEELPMIKSTYKKKITDNGIVSGELAISLKDKYAKKIKEETTLEAEENQNINDTYNKRINDKDFNVSDTMPVTDNSDKIITDSTDKEAWFNVLSDGTLQPYSWVKPVDESIAAVRAAGGTTDAFLRVTLQWIGGSYIDMDVIFSKGRLGSSAYRETDFKYKYDLDTPVSVAAGGVVDVREKLSEAGGPVDKKSMINIVYPFDTNTIKDWDKLTFTFGGYRPGKQLTPTTWDNMRDHKTILTIALKKDKNSEARFLRYEVPAGKFIHSGDRSGPLVFKYVNGEFFFEGIAGDGRLVLVQDTAYLKKWVYN